MNGIEIQYTICAIFVWLFFEISFYMIVKYCIHPKLSNKLSKPIPYLDDPGKFICQILDCLDGLQNYSMEKFIYYFFRGTHYSEVHIDNFKSFLAWAMFGKKLVDLNPEESQKALVALMEVSKRYKCVREANCGHNQEVQHVSMTLESIPYYHFPLISYVISGLLVIISNYFFLKLQGFQKFEVNSITYWYRASTYQEDASPILFLHGITPGWFVYDAFIKSIGKNRTIILVELDGIRIQSMAFEMPTPEQFSNSMVKILHRHHIPSVSVVGHSFGSITAGWIVKHHPEIVNHLTLLDPVSLLLALPDVAYTFLYKQPSTMMEWLLHIFGSRELTISHALHRNFWWYRNNLWLEDIPAHVGVVIGIASCDEITNPTAIIEYVHRHKQKRMHCCEAIQQENQEVKSDDKVESRMPGPIECIEWKNFSHGQILSPGAAQDHFVKIVHNNERYSLK